MNHYQAQTALATTTTSEIIRLSIALSRFHSQPLTSLLGPHLTHCGYRTITTSVPSLYPHAENFVNEVPAPPKVGGHTAQPLPHPIFVSCLLWPNGWMDQDATWYTYRTQVGLVVLDGIMGTQLPPLKVAQPLSFRPMSIVATVAYLSATAELLYKRSPKTPCPKRRVPCLRPASVDELS